MTRLLTLCLSLFLFTITVSGNPAEAASLNELRASGVIGERYDGFAVVRKNKSGAANIVRQVNAKRRSIYKSRAKQQKISPAQVGVVYAQQIFSNAPAGTWFLSRDGSWTRK
ncbi:MAG: YdbL family protein [Rhodospirillaceae bacterium]|jgi:uncharacterized protein YdbL (DUF1318 family)